jgi:predicted RNase H-like nuclease
LGAQRQFDFEGRKERSNKLDAAICALIEMLWRSKNRSGIIMVGNAEFGYMIAPASPEVRARLRTAAANHNVPIDGTDEVPYKA